MSIENSRPILAGYKALIVGVANEDSIAYGCAKAFHAVGADVAITYLNEKAKPHVEPLGEGARRVDLRAARRGEAGRTGSAFRRASRRNGASWISWCIRSPRPRRRISRAACSNCSADGFAMAMDISVHSFIRMARLAAPLMKDGGTMFAMTYHGAMKVEPNYNVMGPVKAALEASCRYSAYELGPQRIRVHAISAGPLKTRPLPAQGLRPDAEQGRQACTAGRTGGHHGCRFTPAPTWQRPTRGD